MKKIALISAIAVSLPMVAAAQADGGAVLSIISLFEQIITALLPVVIGLAILYFIWGLAKYMLSAGDADGQKEARGMMIWGIIIIFVIVSIWGLVGLLASTLGVEDGVVPPAPGIPGAL